MGVIRHFEIQATLVVSATTYSSGNALGAVAVFSAPGMSEKMYLEKVRLLDKANQKIACDVLVFAQTFTGTADKSAINISAADAANLAGHVSLVAGDYATISSAGNGLAVATKLLNPPLPILVSDPLMKIYIQLVTRGAPVLQTTSDIVVLLGLTAYME